MKKFILITYMFIWTCTGLQAQTVIRGPYLQKANSNSVTVHWRTNASTESIVNYGTNLNNLNQSIDNQSLNTDHALEISGLNPETKYYYNIADNNGILVPASSDQYFQTHPTIGTDQAYRFWVLGDCGTANGDAEAVRDAYYGYVGSGHTDGILYLGDNAYNSGTDTEYQNAVFEIYDEKLKNTIAWSCLGNHDGFTADSDSQTGPYYEIFNFPKNGESGGIASGTEAYYSFDYGNIHFISLESYETDKSVGGAMYNWAESDIQNTTQDWIVAIWHHPPYTKGSHNSDTETPLIQMRENFLPMLEANGVDLVMSGHSHSYERSYYINGHYGLSGTFDSNAMIVGSEGGGDGQINGNGAYQSLTNDGAVYITTGSAGRISGNGSLDHPAMHYSVKELGSCVLEVDGDQLDVKFIRENGVTEDYFTIQKAATIAGIDLNNFSSTCGIDNVAGVVELSGLTFDIDDQVFYGVEDNLKIHEIGLDGVVNNSYTLNGFEDTEGIVYLGNSQFALTEERRREIIILTIDSNTPNTINYSNSNIISFDDSGETQNNGFEGLAYDAANDVLYIGKEGDANIDPAIYVLSNPISEIGNTITPTEAFTNLPTCTNFDAAGLAWTPTGSLLILSQACKIIYEVDPANGAILSEKSVAGLAIPEGITMVNDNELWVAGEDNQLQQFVIPGSTCDDGNASTVNDSYDSNCFCAGISDPNFCPNLNLFIGDPCDDGIANTVNDMVNSNCICEGSIPINGLDLDNFNSSCGIDNVTGVVELSGLTFDIDDQVFYGVEDNLKIHEIGLDGVVNNSYTLNGFEDTEGIVYLGNSQFALTEERRREIIILTINSSTPNTINYSNSNIISFDDSGETQNNGFEGLAYDAANDVLYIGKEGDANIDPAIYILSNPVSEIGNTITPTEAFTNLPTCANFDASGLAWTPANSLLILSQACKIIYEVDPANGAILSEKSVAGLAIPEGITMVNDNELWVAGEDNELQQFVIPGSTCDDGNPNTFNDEYDSSCGCVGTLDPNFCPNLNLFIGDPCDDGDPNTSNDIVDNNCNCSGTSINTCDGMWPESESFETDLGDWTQGTDDDLDWIRDSGGTPSSGTGPSTGSDGSWYMYVEASGSNSPNKTASLVSECFNIATTGGGTILFDYHMFGTVTDHMLEFQVTTDDGNTWTTLWSNIGSDGDVWTTVNVNLDLYVNIEVYFRFLGTTGSSWSGDIAIDNILIFDTDGTDCPNLGLDIGDLCDDGDPTTLNDTVNSNCICEGTLDPNFCPNLNLFIGDACDDGDPNTSNDTVDNNCNCTGTTNNTCVGMWPESESFETNLGDWTQGTDDDLDWIRDSGGTPSSGTGPSTGSDGSWYMYVEASGSNNPNKTASLVSECFNVATSGGGTILFDYHMLGTVTDHMLEFQVTTDDGNTWTTLWSNIGSDGNIWTNVNVNLDLYVNIDVYFRFLGTTGSSWSGDIAIDNILIFDTDGADCPNLGLDIGDPCDDGNPNTTGDIVIGGCICQGMAIVCDGTFPETESFESGLGNWTQGTDDDLDWIRDSGGTPSSGTGPSTGSDGSWYMYVEASGSNSPNKTASLVSECFNEPSSGSSQITFDYHMNGVVTDHMLEFQVTSDGGNTWTTLWSNVGSDGDVWTNVNIDLTSYQNMEVYYRFLGTTGSSWSGDTAIDNINMSSGLGFDCPSLGLNIGDACDDGDAATINDVVDNNCNCTGTFVGNSIDITNFNAGCGISTLGINNLSGVTYRPESNTLFGITNFPTEVHEIDLDGNILRTIVLNGVFNDTEGIVHIGGDQFFVAEERERRVTLITISDNTTTITFPGNGAIAFDDSGLGDNFGFEGLAYDASNDILYIGREGDSDNNNTGTEPKVYKVDNPLSELGNLITPVEAFTSLPSCNNFDIGGLAFTSVGSLLLISDNCSTIYELNPSTGFELSTKSITGFAQPEGLTLINDNELWVVGEQDQIAQFVIPGATCEENCYTGATWDNACNCTGGTIIDQDGDGECAGNDPDDMDPCVPDDTDPLCGGGSTCTTLLNNDFESGWQGWVDGGSDCRRDIADAVYANSGSFCIRLRDNTSSSVMTSPTLNTTNSDILELSFSYIARSMDNSTEDFWLQISSDNGATWTTTHTWARDIDFQNDVRENEFVLIATPLNTTTKIRFRCDASTNQDWVYIDDIVLQKCINTIIPDNDPVDAYNSGTETMEDLKSISNTAEELESENRELTKLKNQLSIYPNPLRKSSTLFVEVMNPEKIVELEILSLTGKRLIYSTWNEDSNTLALPIQNVSNGSYLLRVKTLEGIITKKFIVIE